MRLIITRHGQTHENVAGIFQGHMEGRLTDEGIAQAKMLAERLKNEKIDIIYSSDLLRAANTAKEVAKYHEGVPFEITEELRERHLGELQGKHKDNYPFDSKEFLNPEGGESWEETAVRGKEFLDTIKNKHSGETVLFVCHAGIAVGILKKMGVKIEIGGMKNTSVTALDLNKDGQWDVAILNCVEHL